MNVSLVQQIALTSVPTAWAPFSAAADLDTGYKQMRKVAQVFVL